MSLRDSEQNKVEFLSIVRNVLGQVDVITRPQIIDLVKNHQAPDPRWLWADTRYRVGRGVYRIPKQFFNERPNFQMSATEKATEKFNQTEITFDENYVAYVPPVDPLYEPFGNYTDIEKITKSGKFFPYWVYGLSGNGKTLSIEQAHARNKKELVLIPVTKETDEDCLLGGLRMLNGSTVPFYGPVTQAAMIGCTALLDETDMGDEKLMCLQNALQNRPFLIKRLGIIIYPKPGFNIVATANTKGRGSDDGRFIGANVMNDSSLERYIVTFEQDYPKADVERKILLKVLDSLGHVDDKDKQFVERMILWADKVRQTFKRGGIGEVITTRRLVHICRAYDMFGNDRKKAIDRCLARFPDDIRQSFVEFYEAIDGDMKKREAQEERSKSAIAKGRDPETPFD
jgi:AAA domain (dynein-related subfamily)